MVKKLITFCAAALLLVTAAVCGAQNAPVTNLPKVDMNKWQYNADDNVYYQLGIGYCETPADENYENLAILVPGAYFKCTGSGSGTWSCSVDPNGTAGDFTAATAPMKMHAAVFSVFMVFMSAHSFQLVVYVNYTTSRGVA